MYCHISAPRGQVVLTPREKHNENFCLKPIGFWSVCLFLWLILICILCWINHNLDYKRFLWVLVSSCSNLLNLSMVLGTLWTWSCVERAVWWRTASSTFSFWSTLGSECVCACVCVYVCACVCVYVCAYNAGVIMRTAGGYNILINLRYFSPCLFF